MNTKTRNGIVAVCILTTGWLVMTANAEDKPGKTVTQTQDLPLKFTVKAQEGKSAIPQQTKAIKQPFYPALTNRELKIQEVLDTEAEGSFPNVPLLEVMSFLQNQHGINMYLDSQALKEQGLTADEPVNVSVSGISLKSALNIILNPLGLDYVIDNEVLKITTQEKAVRTLNVRIYPVADLCDAPEDYEALEKVIQNTCLARKRNRSKPYSVDDLVIGGTGKKKVVREYGSASISSVPQCRAVVVNDTDRVHEKIVKILTQLREVRQDQEGLSEGKN